MNVYNKSKEKLQNPSLIQFVPAFFTFFARVYPFQNEAVVGVLEILSWLKNVFFSYLRESTFKESSRALIRYRLCFHI